MSVFFGSHGSHFLNSPPGRKICRITHTNIQENRAEAGYSLDFVALSDTIQDFTKVEHPPDPMPAPAGNLPARERYWRATGDFTAMDIPRIVIAGTHSGCGKTTVASGIMAALAKRGYRVQPFKVGPDFIDPSHHTALCGRHSRNLDPFMMGEDGCRATFSRASRGADIAVIEGVMGLFDGVEGLDLASTAHVARILQAPVVLVLDVKGMSRSIHAHIRGFLEFDPTITLAGVIVNRVGSRHHREMMEGGMALPAFGWIPRSDELSLKSRHLGLVMAHESAALNASGPLMEEYCDLDALVGAARRAPPLADVPEPPARDPVPARIGIACDLAFCFYYQDNLDLLRQNGADLVFFSPLAGELPDVDAVYYGGGYPELHLPGLEVSPSTAAIRKAAGSGLPVFAECGGLMYLTREVTGEKKARMAGILPAVTEMTKRLQALGYVQGTVRSSGTILPDGLTVTGHEFHYSRVHTDTDACCVLTLSRGKGIGNGKDGLVAANTLGMYTHAYFSPEFARSLLAAARAFSRS